MRWAVFILAALLAAAAQADQRRILPLFTSDYADGADSWFTGWTTEYLFGDAAGTTQATNGGAVARWEDISGNGRVFTNAVSADAPVYDGYGVRLGGGGIGNRRMFGSWIPTMSGSFAIVAVVDSGSSPANREEGIFTVVDWSSGIAFERTTWSSGCLGLYVRGRQLARSDGSWSRFGEGDSVWAVNLNGVGTVEMWKNGILLTNMTANLTPAMGYPILGFSHQDGLNGHLKELITFTNYVPDIEDRLQQIMRIRGIE